MRIETSISNGCTVRFAIRIAILAIPGELDPDAGRAEIVCN